MFPILQGRAGHYLLLLAVTAGLYLPGLGMPSLWDIDEGNNASCAREMLESDNWIRPTFNYGLRVDKPALLYWLQIGAYRTFGVSEFSARLPSALASMLIVLLVYELGRRLFDAGSGLVAGLVLASALLFCGSAHFANPDALLNACTVLTLLLFWSSFARGSNDWMMWTGLSMGLGFLAKGPVAVVLPLAVIGLFLLWNRQLRRFVGVQMLAGMLLWIAVAVPWFALVGAETKGEFLRGFFLTHNVGRFSAPMEGHSGPVFYHGASLILGFLPWSSFLGLAAWNAWREGRKVADADENRAAAVRFLVCWIAVYFVFFSFSRTKLPNYILPLYPAVAILIGRFLERWRRGEIAVAGWALKTSLVCWALVGVGLAAGLLVAGGTIPVPRLRHVLPGMENSAFLGLLPLLGAAAAWWCLRRQSRDGAIGVLHVSAALFTLGLFTWGASAVDAHKAPRDLVAQAEAKQPEREIRIGCYEWFQPSLVFYCEREVKRFNEEREALEFLQYSVPVYLFVPSRVWERLEPKVEGAYRVKGRHWDLYRNCEVLVIGND